MTSLRTFLLGALLLATACASDAQQKAEDGAKALAACDLRGAHDDFSQAFDLDSSDPSIALAFALTDLTLLAEDPALQKLGPRFGFTKPFDTTFLWEKGGLLDQASQGTATCSALGDFVRANLSHPSLAATNPTPFLDTIDKTLTFGDLRDAGLALSPRLDKLSAALATAAAATGDGGVEIKGGCGASDFVLQKPELFALAGTFTLLHAIFQLLDVYDGSARVWPVFMEIAGETGAESDFVSDMNAAFLHVADASQAPAAKDLWEQAFDLFGKAIDAAEAVKTTPANAVVDWTSFPTAILADARQLAQAAHDVFDAKTALPMVSPAITVDGPSLVSSPLELAPLSPAAWGLDTSNDVTFSSDPITARLGARMSPDPFSSGASYSWSFVDDISNATNAQPNWWVPTFDPGKRFTSSFSCK